MPILKEITYLCNLFFFNLFFCRFKFIYDIIFTFVNMRIILFFLFSLFTSSIILGQYSENIVLKYPKVIISGISNKVYIDNYEDLKMSENELIINNKLTEIKEKNGEYFFEYSFLKDKKIIIENYNCNQPKTNVLPLWLSILPPLIAILFALVFREVLFSLFSGIFVGSSIIGF